MQQLHLEEVNYVKMMNLRCYSTHVRNERETTHRLVNLRDSRIQVGIQIDSLEFDLNSIVSMVILKMMMTLML